MITSELGWTNDWLVVDVDEGWVNVKLIKLKKAKLMRVKIFSLLSY